MKNKITLHNLVLSGTHGHTEREKQTAQRFRLDITIETNFQHAIREDNLRNTIDYRSIKEIARKILHGQHSKLLETIAQKILDEVMENRNITYAEISIKKLDIWDNGIPSVTVSKKQIPTNFSLIDFDYERFVQELIMRGGITLPILPVERRLELISEADTYTFIPQPEIAESPLVREELSSCTIFPPQSPFHILANDFFNMLTEKISSADMKRLFPTPLTFNDMSLQLYKKGSIGITPHRDGKSRINLICVFVLKGAGVHGLCDDRSGSGAYYLDGTPGNVIIIRGPGFINSSYQPFHFVRDIAEKRVVFGLRQRIPKNPT